MQLQQITFSRDTKAKYPDQTKLIAQPVYLTNSELVLTLRKGAVFYFKVTKVTPNQIQTDRPVFGENSYLFFNYIEQLEAKGEARLYIIDPNIDGLI